MKSSQQNWQLSGVDSFYSYVDADAVTPTAIAELRRKGMQSASGRARYCLHIDQAAALHVMIIYHDNRTNVPLHSHSPFGEYLIALSGSFRVVLINKEKKTKIVNVSNKHGNPACFVPAGVWHYLEFDGPTLFYEVSEGPMHEKSTNFTTFSCL